MASSGSNETPAVSIPAQIAPNLDRSVSEFKHGELTKNFMDPVGVNANTLTLANATTQDSKFDIDVDVYNHSNWYIEFDAISSVSVAGSYVWRWADVFPFFYRVRYESLGGAHLIADFQEIPKGLRFLRQAYTKMDDFRNMETYDGLCPSNELKTDVSSVRHNGSSTKLMNYTTPNTFQVGAVSGILGTSKAERIRFPLKALIGTFFELDKFLPMTQKMRLTITWSAAQNIYFTAASNTDPTQTTAAFLGTCAITNLRLGYESQRDAGVSLSLMGEAMNSGIMLPIPFIGIERSQSISAGSNKQVKLSLTPSNGERLKTVFFIPYYDDTKNYVYNNTNMPRSGAETTSDIISIYRTYLNGKPLQIADLKCEVNSREDWKYNEWFLKDSVIRDSWQYAGNWCMFEDFSGANPNMAYRGYNRNELINGLPIHGEMTISCNFTNARDVTVYSYFITQRVLRIGPPSSGNVGGVFVLN